MFARLQRWWRRPGSAGGPWRRLAIGGCVAGWVLGAAGAADGVGRAAREEQVAGPLFQTFPLTLEPGDGVEALGPFYYRRETEDEVIWGIPPFVSQQRSADGEQGHVYILPPLFTAHRYGTDRKWQLLQWISGSNFDAIDEGDVRRFNLLPFFLYQDSPDDRRDYWAIFPLYGTFKNRLFRDEGEFVLFPLWLETRKGSVVTHNVAFPFLHLRDGPGMKGWQFWPLAGHEHLLPGSRTNLAGELEVVPGHDKSFGLWPVWFRNRLGLGTENPSRIDGVLPLYYQERSPLRDHTSMVWPLFSWTDDRTAKFHQWNAPWPLVGFARGEGKTLDRVLPFFSVGHTESLSAQTYLWPLYRRRFLHTPSYERDRWQFAVVLYSDVKQRNLDTGKSSRRIDSWPLFVWTRDADGQERLQAPALFEPLRRGVGIERNWSPLWSIWRGEKDPNTHASSQSLLWNLYRRQVTEGGARTNGSLLFGLVQYERTSAGRRWRWFHFGSAPDAGSVSARPPSDVPQHR